MVILLSVINTPSFLDFYVVVFVVDTLYTAIRICVSLSLLNLVVSHCGRKQSGWVKLKGTFLVCPSLSYNVIRIT